MLMKMNKYGIFYLNHIKSVLINAKRIKWLHAIQAVVCNLAI